MSHSRIVFAAAVALCAAIPGTAGAHVPAPAAIELSAAGQRALKQSSLTLATIPRTTKPKTLWLAPGKTTIGSSAAVELKGTLRFSAGKRKLDAKALKLTVGRTSSSISARLGTKTVRLLTVTPTRPAELDAKAGRVALSGARLALTRPAAQTLRSKLKLKRTPSTVSLGTLTVTIAPPPSTQLAPSPQPIAVPAPAPAATATPTPEPTATPVPTASPTPTATATPLATATPGPNLACAERPAATPVGIVDWFGCALPGTSDLKSWTGYIQREFPPFPCIGPVGTITAGFGASQVVAGDPLDHRFPVLSSAIRDDGSATIVVGGHVTYTMPVHGIDEQIGSLRIEIAAGGATGTVYADGHAKPFDTGPGSCTAAPTPYGNVAVLSLNLAGIAPVTTGGVKRWVNVPATVIDTGDRIGGGEYPASAWGTFTIAVPVPAR
jgi:hypothetical protein